MFTCHRASKIAAATIAALALSATLVACGDEETSSETSAPSAVQTAGNGDVFNDADVRFVSDMIQHHAQAIEMVTLTDGRPLDPEVRQLAEEIRNAQGPEVETMVDWLTAWDQEIPETSMDHANAGHDMDDMGGESSSEMSGMAGMMSEDEMTSLADASDAEFQTMWLEMMIEHHTGAVEMAEDEQADGENADAVALAATIVKTQQAEITTMEGLLG